MCMRPETDLYSFKSSTYLAIFNAPTPEVTFGSDILRLTPANIMAHTYCLDEQQWKQTVSPIQSTTVIGPPKGCNPSQNRNALQHIYLIKTKCTPSIHLIITNNIKFHFPIGNINITPHSNNTLDNSWVSFYIA